MAEGGLFIRKVAELAELNPRTIRYYEASVFAQSSTRA